MGECVLLMSNTSRERDVPFCKRVSHGVHGGKKLLLLLLLRVMMEDALASHFEDEERAGFLMKISGS